MSVVADVAGTVGGLFSSVDDYKQGKASRNLERQSMRFSSDMFRQLEALTQDPSKITEMPMYKAGLESVQRSLASQGLTGSGNAMMALSDYGANYWRDQVNMFAGLAQGGMPQYGTGSVMQAGGAGRISAMGSASGNEMGSGGIGGMMSSLSSLASLATLL